MHKPTAAGGWPAIWYTLRQARRGGGVLRMLRALRTRNACKTCALGMGGQQGGMVNERGHFPEVCKKSVQAMSADMQGKIRDGFFQEFTFDHLARFSPRELEHAGRIVTPLIAEPGDRSYRAIGWDEALERTAGAMKAANPDDAFFYFSGRSSNEAAFLLQLVARLYGTNNVNNCSYFCHQASGVGLKSVTGSGTATITLDDLERADLVFIIGGNPPSNHPRLMSTLVRLKRRGGKVVVVNPLRELGLVRFRVPSDVRSLLFGSGIADEYAQVHIGGDIAFLTGVAKALLEEGAIDSTFIEGHTEGWPAFRASIESAGWKQIERESGVEIEQIRRITRLYAGAKSAVFAWTMGITHHVHGVANVQMIANVALLRGMLGRPGAGLLPLRGHSNVQGVGSVGAVPNLSGPVLEAFEQRLGVTFPTTPGLDTLACIERAAAGGVRFAWHLGGNLYGSCPDAAAARIALSKIDLTVFLSTTLNTGHIHGRGRTSIILPVRARDEEAEPTTQESMFNYVRLSDGGPPRHDGPRGEVAVIAHIARRVLEASDGAGSDGAARSPIDFADMERHSSIRRSIAQVIPGYEQIGQIDRTRREFTIDGRTFHAPRFATESKRARFHVCPIPQHDGSRGDDGTLRLMTIRSEGQFNTVVYEEEDLYRGQERRDVILMNEQDIARLKLAPDDRVTVVGPAGRMEALVRAAEIRAGNAAMYYPEANALLPQTADPYSRTPSFKNTPIQIEKSRRLATLP